MYFTQTNTQTKGDKLQKKKFLYAQFSLSVFPFQILLNLKLKVNTMKQTWNNKNVNWPVNRRI